MRNFHSLLVLIFTSLCSLSASAGLLIEPYFAIESGTLEAVDKTTSINAGGSTSATTLGARLGYKAPALLWVAADYAMGTGGKAKMLLTEMDYSRTSLYLDVGVDLPILFRAWLGYGMTHEMKLSASGSDTTLKKGSTIKVGGAYSGLPFVSINLEYYTFTPSEVTDSSGTTDASASYSSLKETGMNIGVSVPFNL